MTVGCAALLLLTPEALAAGRERAEARDPKGVELTGFIGHGHGRELIRPG